MKKIILGLIALSSISAFAQVSCPNGAITTGKIKRGEQLGDLVFKNGVKIEKGADGIALFGKHGVIKLRFKEKAIQDIEIAPGTYMRMLSMLTDKDAARYGFNFVNIWGNELGCSLDTERCLIVDSNPYIKAVSFDSKNDANAESLSEAGLLLCKFE